MLDWLDPLLKPVRELEWWQALLISVGLFVVMFFGSIGAVAFVLVRLPSTYFQTDHQPAFLWERRHAALRWTALIGKNVFGVLLVVVGIILSLPGVPGQGLLTILIGLMLISFPGKRRLEQKLVSRPGVFQAVNRLRARFGKPPLVLDDQPPARQVSEAEKITL